MKLNIDIVLEDLFSFDKMIAMPAIKIMYLVGLMCVVLISFALMFQGNLMDFLYGLGLLATGCVLWRILCETAIVLFGIYDRLGEIRNVLTRREEDLLLLSAKKENAEMLPDKESAKSEKSEKSGKGGKLSKTAKSGKNMK